MDPAPAHYSAHRGHSRALLCVSDSCHLWPAAILGKDSAHHPLPTRQRPRPRRGALRAAARGIGIHRGHHRAGDARCGQRR
eukprot:12894205-Prorocentrum_lima.AAC.1